MHVCTYTQASTRFCVQRHFPPPAGFCSFLTSETVRKVRDRPWSTPWYPLYQNSRLYFYWISAGRKWCKSFRFMWILKELWEFMGESLSTAVKCLQKFLNSKYMKAGRAYQWSIANYSVLKFSSWACAVEYKINEINGQGHETVHLGQSLSRLSIVNSLNLVRESCHLEDEQTKAGKGEHQQWFGVSHWCVSEIDLTHLKCCPCTRSFVHCSEKGQVRCWVNPLFKCIDA